MGTTLIKQVNDICLYELTNGNGMSVQINTYGARIHKILVKNNKNEQIDIVAGYNEPEQYVGDTNYFNGVVGRVANRIDHAKFTLNGKEYKLTNNDGVHSLHGGKEGFDKKIWKAEVLESGALRLTYRSPDGEEGYPGNLDVTVVYMLDEENALHLYYEAVSDRDTLCSLTNHANFNLDGDFVSVLDHEVYINADKINLIDADLISHGELKPIIGTAYDFSVPKKIGADIKTDDFMLKIARGGYDFNYILNNDKRSVVASAYSARSGVRMEVFTDQPCLQMYTGNFLDNVQGKRVYPYQSAFCMETQGYPNACNVPSFPSIVLKKGDRYHAHTAYKFSVEK